MAAPRSGRFHAGPEVGRAVEGHIEPGAGAGAGGAGGPGRDWIRARLRPASQLESPAGGGLAPPARGDHDLNPGWAIPDPLIPAAVLVLWVERPAGPTILLTLRAAGLRQHAGQVSFPGGRLDPGDPGPVACALREAREEVGLVPERVDVLGGLDVYAVRTGYAVAPVVAAASPPLSLSPADDEVAAVLELPVSVVLDPGSYRVRTLDVRGARRRFYALEHEGALIWGATAGMLNNLRELLG